MIRQRAAGMSSHPLVWSSAGFCPVDEISVFDSVSFSQCPTKMFFFFFSA